MNKPEKGIVSAVAFLVATFISISLFGLFSAWAMSALDPAQQEAIAAVTTPWIPAARDRSGDPGKTETAINRDTTTDRPAKARAAARR